MNKLPTIIFITYVISCNGNLVDHWNVMSHHSVQTEPPNHFTVTNRINESSSDISDHPGWKLVEDEEQECGESNADRIIGGNVASLSQYPWIAMIYYENDGRLWFQCTGTLISSMYVATAAHCVSGLQSSLKLVRLGEYDKSTAIDCVSGVCADEVQDIKVVKTVYHDQYDKPQLLNDVALLRLEHPIKYNGWVSPICLPRGGSGKYDSGTAELAGWGITNMTTHYLPNIMQTLKVPLISMENCKKVFTNSQLDNQQICAGGQVGKDSCNGDSGGPLMRVEAWSGTPKYYLIGIVSFGTTMCGENKPAVYVNVEHFVRWFLDHIEP